MGKFEDYINSLEGQENIDLTEVVSEMTRLHTEEIGSIASTGNAKIEQLTSQLTDKESAIAEREAEISRVKAANWDLVNQLPATPETPEPPDDGVIDQRRITLDDAFTQ